MPGKAMFGFQMPGAVLTNRVVGSPSIEDLDAEQRAALIAFQVRNGRMWKSKLLEGWLASRFSGPLQQIRNAHGPSWLLGLKHVPAYRLEITIKSGDGCEGSYSVALNEKARPAESRITWSPEEPDADTVSVTLDLYDGDELKGSYVASGDYWRALEDGGLDVDLWDRILKGEAMEAAVETMPVSGSKLRM